MLTNVSSNMFTAEFSTWFHSNALQQLKQSLQQFDQLVNEQMQIYNMESKTPTNVIPAEYLEFQVERCVNSFKADILSNLRLACFKYKFTTSVKVPIDKPIKLLTGNTLMQRAKLAAVVPALQFLPQLAFLDIETDGTCIESANILQVSIIKPIIDSEHSSMSYFTSWSSYVLPWDGYTQKDNKAFHINHIGDKTTRVCT